MNLDGNSVIARVVSNGTLMFIQGMPSDDNLITEKKTKNTPEQVLNKLEIYG